MTQGICPVGWHIPSDYEWKVMENDSRDGSNSGKMLQDGEVQWKEGNSKQQGLNIGILRIQEQQIHHNSLHCHQETALVQELLNRLVTLQTFGLLHL